MMFQLPPWGRWAMIAGGVCVVLITIVVVLCIVVPKCWLHKIFIKEKEEKKRKKKTNGSFYESQTLCGVVTSSPSKELKDGIERSDSVLTQSSGKISVCSSRGIEKHVETSSLLSSNHDSTYSSMSEYSDRSSPVSCQSSVVGSVRSASISEQENRGQLTFGLQYIGHTHDISMGKLVITVLEAENLLGKEYPGGTCDSFIQVSVWKERRSLRKHKSPVLHAFRTRTIRHTRSPAFNQSFIMDVDKTQLKDLVVKLTVLDEDKWANPSTMGEVTQPLKDIKNLAAIDHRTTVNYFLAPSKLDLGEILFGLSYLPTAQRLSVSIVKANRLGYQNLVEEISDFNPFVRVLLLGSTGRLLKKKKTSWVSSTTSPSWNETLIFDVSQAQMEQITFLLVICSRSQLPLTPSNSDLDSYQSIETLPDLTMTSDDPGQPELQKKDKCLGKVILGCNVRNESCQSHWLAVVANPRKVTSQWHNLK